MNIRYYLYTISIFLLIISISTIISSIIYSCAKIDFCNVPLNSNDSCCTGFTCDQNHLYSTIAYNCYSNGTICQYYKYVNNPVYPLICTIGLTFGIITCMFLIFLLIHIIRKWYIEYRFLISQKHQQIENWVL